MEIESALRPLIVEIVREELARVRGDDGAGYLDVRAAAAYTSVAPGTVRRWVRQGALPEYRVGRELRVKRADLDRLMQRGRRPRPPSVEQSPEVRGRKLAVALQSSARV